MKNSQTGEFFYKNYFGLMDSRWYLWHSVFMKKSSFINRCLLVLGSTFLVACVSNPPDDQFTNAEPIQTETAKSINVLDSSMEIQVIDGQLSTVNAQIQAAQARLNHYQMQDSANPVIQSQMTGIEAELSHYQMLKNNLMTRKQELNLQSTIK